MCATTTIHTYTIGVTRVESNSYLTLCGILKPKISDVTAHELFLQPNAPLENTNKNYQTKKKKKCTCINILWVSLMMLISKPVTMR